MLGGAWPTSVHYSCSRLVLSTEDDPAGCSQLTFAHCVAVSQPPILWRLAQLQHPVDKPLLGFGAPYCLRTVGIVDSHTPYTYATSRCVLVSEELDEFLS